MLPTCKYFFVSLYQLEAEASLIPQREWHTHGATWQLPVIILNRNTFFPEGILATKNECRAFAPLRCRLIHAVL